MTPSVGKETMSVAWSACEFVRDMVGEVGGVLKISKSSPAADMSQVPDRLVGAARWIGRGQQFL